MTLLFRTCLYMNISAVRSSVILRSPPPPKSEQKSLLLQFWELHANGSFYTSIVSLITLMIRGELTVMGWLFGTQIRVCRGVSAMPNFTVLCYQVLATSIKTKLLTSYQAGVTEPQLPSTKIDYLEIHCAR